MTVSLRNSQDYKEYTLDRLYGILKTYKLEIEQDEQMERGKKKGGAIALVVSQEKEMKDETVDSAPNPRVCEGKGKSLVAELEDQVCKDDMDEIDEHLAFLSRRPLIGDERLQGCKDCVSVVPGKPQVQLGPHSFAFDHVYKSSGSPSSGMFEDCVAPLVDGLFQGYNATVLAYGQTGSGKTYTMGTGSKDGNQIGLVPQVMNTSFSKIETLKHQTEFQLQVSFIEDTTSAGTARRFISSDMVSELRLADESEMTNGHSGKVTSPGKQPIQIRETSNGVITLAGSTERSVKTLKEMADCLEQGSLSRATGSTNMNNQSR
ncbi:hypothetical protein AgCh_028164 [Apium graveolens]